MIKNVKIYFVIASFLSLLNPFVSHADERADCDRQPTHRAIYKTRSAKTPQYLELDVPPEFPGGNDSLYQWLSDNIKYPDEAAKGGFKGRVIVEFTTDQNGELENARTLVRLHPAIDREVLRVIRSMPKWKPVKFME